LIFINCIWAVFYYAIYHFTHTFYVMASIAGLGGIQALSRSTYSKLLPEHDTASFFSFMMLLKNWNRVEC
jgi:UMF1 family MFS transporter